MGVGPGLYMYEYDVVVKSSGSLSHLLMSSCNLSDVTIPQRYLYSVIGPTFMLTV